MVFYKPRPGIVGDVIPYFHDGVFHVFYLRDYRDLDGYGPGGPWHHVTTTDFVHFEDRGEAISKGTENDQDMGPATGSVFTDDAGLHHIFYTGINAHFRTKTEREQVILHATSTDLVTWTKDPDWTLNADEDLHERHDWRDPFVYRHPVTGRPTMLVAARTREGDPATRGCTAILESDGDLREWRDVGAYMPHRYHGHECPDLFRMGEWYYLVFSEYNEHTVTRYVMSRTPDGPWDTPADNQFDNRAFYAAKTAADENGRRYLFGWNPSKAGDRDEGEWQWGGKLTVHEITQRPDGTLTVTIPDTVRAAFASPQRTKFPVLPQAPWSVTADTVEAASAHARSTLGLGALPERGLLEGTISFDDLHGAAGILFNTENAGDGEARGGYFLRFNVDEQRLQFGRVGGYRPWYVDHMPELDRPLAIDPGAPLTYRVVFDGSALVAYVDDTVALSARMYSRPRAGYGLFVDGTRARFTAPTLRLWASE